MPDVPQTGADQAAVIEKVKQAETDAKSRVAEASSQAEKIKSDAVAEAQRILKDAESAGTGLKSKMMQSGRAEIEREVASISKEASEGAEKIRRQKEKRVALKEIIESVLGF